MSMVMKQCPAHRAVFLCSNANDRLRGEGRDAAWFVVCSMFPQKQIAECCRVCCGLYNEQS